MEQNQFPLRTYFNEMTILYIECRVAYIDNIKNTN